MSESRRTLSWRELIFRFLTLNYEAFLMTDFPSSNLQSSVYFYLMLQSDPSTVVVNDGFVVAMANFYHTFSYTIPVFSAFQINEEGLFYVLVLGGTNFYVLGVQLRCQFLLSWEHLITSCKIYCQWRILHSVLGTT
ncbi:hypothetical protein K1719_026728 [Acacia pycnantha]|nr:hypothetical protein K1719_026728 [Acacia pycnantha]